ncbi:hypothetical protein ACWEGE_05830 [Amycolatopsis sp. NPDC004747]
MGADLHGHRGQRHRDRIRMLERHGVGHGTLEQVGGLAQQRGVAGEPVW